MIYFNSPSRKKLNMRAQLKPILSKFPEAKSIEGLTSVKSNEVLFSSPQPQFRPSQAWDSSPILNLPTMKKSQSPTPLKLSKLFQDPKEKSSKAKRKTPPHIRKLEKFWQKLGNIEPDPKGYLSPQSLTSRRPNKRETLTKIKVTGIPARFREVEKKIEDKIGFVKDKKALKKDLYMIKINDGADLKERLEIAKLARKYHDGKMVDRELEDDWRWYTPKSSATERSEIETL